MTIYRVEKDGTTFYVQPSQLQYYADNGYKIYKTVEESVIDVAGEMKTASAEMEGHSAVAEGEEDA